MATRLKRLEKFFKTDIWDVFKKPTSATEAGAEVSKASLELAVALGLLGSTLAPAGVAVAGLSFVGLTTKAIKYYQEKTQEESSLEEFITLASRLAYIESFERILQSVDDKALLAKIEKMHVDEAVTEKITEISEQEARTVITCFRQTQLAENFNRQLSFCLKITGLTKAEAET